MAVKLELPRNYEFFPIFDRKTWVRFPYATTISCCLYLYHTPITRSLYLNENGDEMGARNLSFTSEIHNA